MFYFLQSKFDYINKNPRGIGIPHVDPDIFWNIEFPLCSIIQQKNVALKIEELFTQLEAGVASLKQTKEQLQTYRQALLKAAFEGKLTEKWRVKQKLLGNYDVKKRGSYDYIESTSTLIEKILDEKRKNWEKNYLLGKKSKEITSKNESWKKKYKGPSFEYEFYHPLPDSWKVANLKIVSDEINDCLHSTPKLAKSGQVLLKSENIKYGKFDFSKKFYVTDEDYIERSRRSELQEGDILFVREGTIGTSAIIPSNFRACMGQRMLQIRINENLNHKFFFYCLLSPIIKAIILRNQMGTTATRINMKQIRNLLVPIPPKKEQDRIVDEIELMFSIIDNLITIVKNSERNTHNLRQTILKQAFIGKLVPQISDEILRDETIKMQKIKSKQMRLSDYGD